MTATPIQKAIDTIRYKVKFSTIAHSEELALTATILLLESLLPYEREQMKRCFEAGWNNRDDSEYELTEHPDFNEFFTTQFNEK